MSSSRTIPLYPHELDALLASNPRLKATWDALLAEHEDAVMAAFDEGIDYAKETVAS